MTTSSVDAVGCIQSRACTSGTNLNLCSCFPIEIHPYFFCPHLQSIPADPWNLPGSVAACGRPSAGCTILAIGQEQPFGPLGRAQLRGVGTQCCSVRGSAWSKKPPQKTPESSSYSVKQFCLTRSNREHPVP